jgi:hypothetical protein
MLNLDRNGGYIHGIPSDLEIPQYPPVPQGATPADTYERQRRQSEKTIKQLQKTNTCDYDSALSLYQISQQHVKAGTMSASARPLQGLRTNLIDTFGVGLHDTSLFNVRIAHTEAVTRRTAAQPPQE